MAPMAGEQQVPEVTPEQAQEAVTEPHVVEPDTAPGTAPDAPTEPEQEATKRLIVYRNGMEITDEQRLANGVVGVKLWPGMRLWI